MTTTAPTFADRLTLADRLDLEVQVTDVREHLPGGGWGDPQPALQVDGGCCSATVRATGPEDTGALLAALRCVAPVLRHWTPDDPAVRDLAAVLEGATA